LAVGVLLVSGAEVDWTPALSSQVDNEDFYYGATVWEDGTPFNHIDTDPDANALYPAYSSVYVSDIEIQLNNKKHAFELPLDLKQRFTLQQLVFSDGIELVGNSRVIWRTGMGRNFNMARSSNKYCFNFGVNYPDYPQAASRWPDRARVRVGVILGPVDGNGACTTLSGAEGVGISAYRSHRDMRLGSGQLYSDDATPRAFARATVWVKGNTRRANSDRVMFFSPIAAGIFGDPTGACS
jgi:hypothetical protein